MNNNAELLEKAQSGDAEAEERIVRNNMGLVYSLVGRFANRRCETEDLMQIGAIGLIKAVKRFDASFGVQFSTYAVPLILGEIKRFLRDDGVIKVSRSIKEKAVRGKLAEERLRERLGRNPCISEISAETGIAEEELVEAFEASVEPESLYSGMDGGERSAKQMELPAPEDTEETVVDRVFLKEALAKLDKRERDILIMRYFRGRTQSEIASVMGVSQVQISRIEKKALEKIRRDCVYDGND